MRVKALLVVLPVLLETLCRQKGIQKYFPLVLHFCSSKDWVSKQFSVFF